MNQPRGLDLRANRTEWARRVSPPPSQKNRGHGNGPRKKDYGDSTKPGVCDRLDAPPKGSASHKSLLLNEPGLALNVFWLPAYREEGVRCQRTKVRRQQSSLSPRPDATLWNQMGD